MDSEKLELHTGCNIEPPKETDFPYEIIAGGKQELPERYKIDVPWHFYQNGIPMCVGAAIAMAKSVQEETELSPRVEYHGVKKALNYEGWGGYVSHGLDYLVKNGIPKYGFVDEKVTGISDYDFMRIDETQELVEASKPYKAFSYWWVRGWQYGEYNPEVLKQALFNEKIPLITTMWWYTSYNSPINGFLPKPSGKRYGHAFILKGWDIDESGREYFIFQNSWQETWGDKGDFYIYVDEIEQYHVSTCYVITDIPQGKAHILAKYQGQIIRNADKPEHYFVGKRYIAHIKNESSFYFGRDNEFWGDWSDTKTIDIPIEHDIVF